MIELPEAAALSAQANKILKGKTVKQVFTASSPHKFTFYHGDPADYDKLLSGTKVTGAQNLGIFVDIEFEGGVRLSIHDGVNMRYGEPGAVIPAKYQLLIGFTDESFLVFTVAMHGSIMVYEGRLDNKYYDLSANSISPLSEAFDKAFFDDFLSRQKPTLSAKALLATEQRIPGVGNGVLQDILFNARIHPKRKLATLTDDEKVNLFAALKGTLKAMADAGGRDTESGLTGDAGGYKTILSRNTFNSPCTVCGSAIVKEAYLGGAVYYCPQCQKL